MYAIYRNEFERQFIKRAMIDYPWEQFIHQYPCGNCTTKANIKTFLPPRLAQIEFATFLSHVRESLSK